ncbi:hypothetical protein M409DRAFT_62563 [Zasmidium cellare ATCC 36951]|uniref:GED domain-containing protein n=1 Tax=Zasmidium cellare ATCC 36951 TaxID=1080233 RepID=A0A6A6D156_ZASCE|nr:uncharacterized protein M409DRAFT_62563 [Zasmidium cellare ATCC 36951]KAF2172905.1 hypothetical protein M409DRAFT_62563 [Zasmidium cellare ATCC 36951]
MSNATAGANGDVDMADSNTTNGAHDTTTTAGVHALGDHSRQLIQAIQMLEALNVDATLPSLPKFVVIGDQSAGKSSIIEAVSEITLPRSAGTCTRCPFRITTTAAKDGQEWTCNVSLQIRYSYNPHLRANKSGESFNGWSENKDTLSLPFANVTDKAQLEIILRRAQFALLNPDKNYTQFLNSNVDFNGEDSDSQTVRFSPNVISLEITAPGLPDLSFYDLPGAINTLGDENDQYLVDFVERLLKCYVREDKALILLACAANQDLETSTAFRYLRECRASYRTMGVLTKPDLIDLTPARVKYLQNLLSGNKNHHHLDNKWYVTRQLSQRELDQQTSYEAGRNLEKDFFSGEPWSTELAGYASRFGVPNLQAALSRKLVQHILGDLPEIVERVQTRLFEINAQLAMFPEQDAAPGISVAVDIEKVNKSLYDQLNADSLRSSMRKDYRDIFRKLSKRLQDLKPKVKMTTPGYQKPSISVESSDEEESPSKMHRTMNGRAMSVVNTPNRSSRPPRRTPASTPNSQTSENFAVFRLDDVRAKFDAAPGADLQAQASESVVRGLILDTLVGWPSSTDTAIKNIRQVFIEMLDSAVASALAKRQKTELYNKVVEITHALFEELFQNVEGFIHELIAAETHRPITYNSGLKQQKAVRNAEYHQLRREQRVAEHYEMLETQGHRMVSQADQKKKAADVAWVTATLGGDEYEREVDALATPIAYYDIAATQLVDSIAKLFEAGLMHAYEGRIHRKLMEELRTTDAAYCAQLLAEDPEREAQRAELMGEKMKLEQALAELNRLPANHLPN